MRRQRGFTLVEILVALGRQRRVVGIDLVEFAVRAVITDQRGVNRRETGQITEVLVRKILEGLVRGAVRLRDRRETKNNQ